MSLRETMICRYPRRASRIIVTDPPSRIIVTDPPSRIIEAVEETMICRYTGTYIHSNHLQVEGAWACPWMDMSLISMSKLMQDGFTLIAEGAYGFAVSPLKQVHKFKVASSGLLAIVPGAPELLQVSCRYRQVY